MKGPRRAVAVAVAVLVVALVYVLGVSGSDSLYSNGQIIELGVVLRGGQQACETGQRVPAGARRVRVWVSTGGLAGSPLAVTVREGGAVLAKGRSLTAYRDSPVDIGGFKIDRENEAATICVRNRGPGQVAVMGTRVVGASRLNVHQRNLSAARQGVALVDGRLPPQHVVMRLQWLAAREHPWLTRASSIATRASLGKPAFFGAWTFWLAMTATALAAVGALVALVRSVRV